MVFFSSVARTENTVLILTIRTQPDAGNAREEEARDKVWGKAEDKDKDVAVEKDVRINNTRSRLDITIYCFTAC